MRANVTNSGKVQHIKIEEATEFRIIMKFSFLTFYKKKFFSWNKFDFYWRKYIAYKSKSLYPFGESSQIEIKEDTDVKNLNKISHT